MVIGKETEEISIVVPDNQSLPVVSKNRFIPLGENEIRVKMMTMGYCGRDKSTIVGQKTAVVGRIGHEGAGVVVETGTSVSHVEAGQNVVIFPFINKHNIGYDWPEGGKGIFSNYPVVPSDAIHPIRKLDVSNRDWLAFSLIEPFSGVSRALKRGAIEKRELLVILGAGPIGCEQSILARYQNPDLKIVLVDNARRKIRLAEQLGIPADHFFHLDNLGELKALISELSIYNEKTLIIHSNPFKSSLKQAFQIAPDGSAILFFSGIYDWDEIDNKELGVALDPKKIHYEEYDEEVPKLVRFENKEIHLIGSRGFTRDDFEFAAELIISNKIDPLPIVTKILKFDENIVDNLRMEGEKETNIKILMSPYDEFVQMNSDLFSGKAHE